MRFAAASSFVAGSHMAEFSDLPAAERTMLYRKMAEDADRMAGCSTGAVHEAYASMAKHWRRLADELDPDKRARLPG
jgi:uncharacterized protein (DUF2236 family)